MELKNFNDIDAATIKSRSELFQLGTALLFIVATMLYALSIHNIEGDKGILLVPVLIAIMAWAFGTYLILKGVKKIWKVDFITALGIGFTLAIAIFFLVKPLVAKAAEPFLCFNPTYGTKRS
jgi:hypothetical protein